MRKYLIVCVRHRDDIFKCMPFKCARAPLFRSQRIQPISSSDYIMPRRACTHTQNTIARAHSEWANAHDVKLILLVRRRPLFPILLYSDGILCASACVSSAWLLHIYAWVICTQCVRVRTRWGIRARSHLFSGRADLSLMDSPLSRARELFPQWKPMNVRVFELACMLRANVLICNIYRGIRSGRLKSESLRSSQNNIYIYKSRNGHNGDACAMWRAFRLVEHWDWWKMHFTNLNEALRDWKH